MVLVLLESVFLHSEYRCKWGLSRCHQHYREAVWFLQVSMCRLNIFSLSEKFQIRFPICRQHVGCVFLNDNSAAQKVRNLPLLWLKTTDLQTKHKCYLCKHDPVRMTENDREVLFCSFLPVVLTADGIYIAHLCSFARWLINEKKWKIADTTDELQM